MVLNEANLYRSRLEISDMVHNTPLSNTISIYKRNLQAWVPFFINHFC